MNRSTSHPIIDVAAGLIFRDGRLLLTQRLAGSHLEGLWEFPGGKREERETFHDCLRRELQEELGVQVGVHQLIDAITHEYPSKTVHLRFYRCTLTLGEPRAIGCAAVAWAEPSELDRFQFPPADARLLELIRNSPHLWNRAV